MTHFFAMQLNRTGLLPKTIFIDDVHFELAINRKTGLLRSQEGFLTDGAVGPHPVGVAGAEPGVGQVGAVAAALLGTLRSRQLAAQPPPARAAQALPVHTHPVAGARWV